MQQRPKYIVFESALDCRKRSELNFTAVVRIGFGSREWAVIFRFRAEWRCRRLYVRLSVILSQPRAASIARSADIKADSSVRSRRDLDLEILRWRDDLYRVTVETDGCETDYDNGAEYKSGYSQTDMCLGVY